LIANPSEVSFAGGLLLESCEAVSEDIMLRIIQSNKL